MRPIDEVTFVSPPGPVQPGVPVWFGLFALAAVIVVMVLLARRPETRSWGFLAGAVGLAMTVLYFYRSAGHVDATPPGGVTAVDATSAPAIAVSSPPRVTAPHADAVRATEPGDARAEPPSAEPPEWVEQAGSWRRDRPYLTAVMSETGYSVDRCWEQLCRFQLNSVVHDYCQNFLGPRPGGVGPLSPQMLRSLVAEQYVERPERGWRQGMNEQVKLFVRVDFTPEVRQKLLAYRAENLIEERLGFTAVIGGVLLALVGVIFGYFKLDAFWEGAHRTKLRVLLGVLLIAIGVCAITAVVVYVDVEHRYGAI